MLANWFAESISRKLKWPRTRKKSCRRLLNRYGSVQTQDADPSAAAQPAEGLDNNPYGCSECSYGTEGCTACNPTWSKQRGASQKPAEPSKEVLEHGCPAPSIAGDASASQPSTVQNMPASATNSLPDPVPAPHAAAPHADGGDAVVAEVKTIADPAALVDFPFNTRRGEQRAAPCSGSGVPYTASHRWPGARGGASGDVLQEDALDASAHFVLGFNSCLSRCRWHGGGAAAVANGRRSYL